MVEVYSLLEQVYAVCLFRSVNRSASVSRNSLHEAYRLVKLRVVLNCKDFRSLPRLARRVEPVAVKVCLPSGTSVYVNGASHVKSLHRR
jgi:hypothetical protein